MRTNGSSSATPSPSSANPPEPEPRDLNTTAAAANHLRTAPLRQGLTSGQFRAHEQVWIRHKGPRECTRSLFRRKFEGAKWLR